MYDHRGLATGLFRTYRGCLDARVSPETLGPEASMKLRYEVRYQSCGWRAQQGLSMEAAGQPRTPLRQGLSGATNA